MRLVTFNILHGRSPRDGVVDLDRFAEAVRSLDAEVLALQEVDREQPRSHLADLTAVAAEAMGAVSHRFVAALAGTPGATWIAATGDDVPTSAAFGIALLSRFPAQTWQTLRLPRIPVRFPLWLPEPRKLIVVHDEPRPVVIGTFDTGSGPLVVANTHLSFVPGWRRRQLQRIRRDLAAVPGRLVLMGDLNMTDPTPEQLTGFSSLARHATFPVDAPTRQLDHILARSPGFEITSTAAVSLPLSDHRALVVDVADG